MINTAHESRSAHDDTTGDSSRFDQHRLRDSDDRGDRRVRD